jgi:hypothetical protein
VIRLRRLAGCLLVSALGLAACAPPAWGPAPAASAQPVGDLLYLHTTRKLPANAARLSIIDPRTGSQERDLPLGAIAPDWSVMYTLEHLDGITAVRAVALPSGNLIRQTTLEGRFTLPRLSANGLWLAIRSGDGPKSHEVVLDTASLERRSTDDPGGSDHFDALSTESGLALPPCWGNASATAPDGRSTFLLKVTANGASITARDMAGESAVHILLPYTSWHTGWSLTFSADGARLYAANGVVGLLVEVDTAQRKILRQADLPKKRARIVESLMNSLAPAAAAKGPWESCGAVLAPDRRTLFIAGETEVIAIDTANLSVRRRYQQGHALDGLAMSSDGQRLYALKLKENRNPRERTRLLRLDVASGAVTWVDVTWANPEVQAFALLHVGSGQ